MDNKQFTEIEQNRERRNRNSDESEVRILPSKKSTLCVGYSEIDKYAIQIYEKHFGGHKNYGNARDIKPEELPDFDLLVGGFPCQAFSIAGKRGGFEDTRGTLFFEIARIIKRKQPTMFVLENVKGLLNHDKGNTFTKILQTIDELGYDAEWQVLNSKHFGVPQNRERVFIVGHIRKSSGRKIFPLRSTSKEPNKWAASLQHPGHSGGNYKGMNMIYDKGGKIYNNGDCAQANRIYHPNGVMSSQRANTRNLIKIADYRNDEGLRIRKDNMSPCLSARRHSETDISTMPNLVIPVLTPDRAEKRQAGRRFKEDGDPAFTVTAQDRHGIYNGSKIRRLTPIECERLQGFPDNWTEGISDTQRYKCLGNAVTVNVIEAIFNKILNV